MQLLVNETSAYDWHKDGYTISTDRSRLDMAMITRFLAEEAYWSPGIQSDLVVKAIKGSLPFGVYDAQDRQMGFARVVTDGSLFAYLRDVFVLKEHRGKGLGRWLAEVILQHPDLGTVKRWMLATDDAHGVYEKVGFEPITRPDWFMQLVR